MIKRLTSYALFFIRKLTTVEPLTVTVLRRYGLTSGSVGELYVNDKCVSDSLDTFNTSRTEYIDTVAVYDDFYHLRLGDKLVVNNVELANKKIRVRFINKWVAEW